MINPHEPIRTIIIPELDEVQPKVEAPIDYDNPVFNFGNNESIFTTEIDAEISYFNVHGALSKEYVTPDEPIIKALVVFGLSSLCVIAAYALVGLLL